MLHNFKSFNENKFWYKTISDLLSWIEMNSNRVFVVIDTETTGLRGPKKEQLTQIAGIAYKYNYKSNRFEELDSFNKKIKLTDDIKGEFGDPESKVKWVLSFNHYGDSNGKYYNENDVLKEFKTWLNGFGDFIFVIQNASFDMSMLNVRSKSVRFNNTVLDTKDLLQLFYLPLLLKLSEVDDKYKKMVNNIGTSSRDNGLISSSLSKVGPAMGLDMVNYHDAKKDCELTKDMLVNIIELLKNNIDIDISKYQYDRIKTKSR